MATVEQITGSGASGGTSIDLGTVWNTSHWSASIDLTNYAAVYTLTTATFLAQIRESIGDDDVLFEWKTGGSLVTPGNSVAYDNSSKLLTLDSTSEDLLEAFPSGGTFWWEVGFYLSGAPDDFYRIGGGRFPINNGVVR
jgi:hypothetical protein